MTNAIVDANSFGVPDPAAWGYDPAADFVTATITGEIAGNFARFSPGDLVHTVEVEVKSVTQLDAMAIQEIFDAVANDAAQQDNRLIAAYAWGRPDLNVAVPDQFCVLDQCWRVPTTITLPGGVEIPLAGTTVAQGLWRYRLWFAFREPVGAGTAMVARALAPLAIIAIVIGMLVGIVLIFEIVTVASGERTWTEAARQMEDFINRNTPSGQITPLILAGAVPMAVFGLVLVVGSQLGPALSGGGGLALPIPGGGQVSGNIGVGGGGGDGGGRGRGRR